MKHLSNVRFQAINTPQGPLFTFSADTGVERGQLGLKFISFVFVSSEFEKFATDTFFVAHDSGYIANSCGDLVTFAQFSVPQTRTGEQKIPYVNVIIPMFVRKVIRTRLLQMLKERERGDRVELSIPQKTVERWSRQYGQGSGDVRINMDDRTTKLINHYLNQSDSLMMQLDRLHLIAKNTTYRFFHTASLNLSCDDKHFYWDIVDPRGRIVLNGGIINHSENGEDWLIHT